MVALVAIISAIVAFCIFKVEAVPSQAPVKAQTGALTGPVIPSPFLVWGGVVSWKAIDAFNTGTSTLCEFQSPAATSTLKGVTVRFDSLPSYATNYELGYSATTQNSTSTAIVASYTPAGTQTQFSATTTVTAIANDGIVAPNSWISFNLSTSTATGASIATGECTANWDQL